MRSTKDFSEKVDFSEEAIERHYQRFGGIFRHVLPSTESAVLQAKNSQDEQLKAIKVSDLFVPYRSMEKKDNQRKNVSDLLLQYNVKYGREWGKCEFTEFTMKIASEYVKGHIFDLNDEKLVDAINSLRLMFMHGEMQDWKLFQEVVYQLHSFNKWQILDGNEWKEHLWDLNQRKELAKDHEQVEKMEPGVLYKPVDPKFLEADFVFVKPRTSHSTPKRTCCNFFKISQKTQTGV